MSIAGSTGGTARPALRKRATVSSSGRYAFVLPEAIARGELRPLWNLTAPGHEFEEDLS
jgi:hypothetical protein